MLRCVVKQKLSCMTGVFVLALSLGVGVAQAVPFADLVFVGEVNSASDNDAEYLINCTAGAAGCSTSISALSGRDTIVDVGDRLRGAISFDQIQGFTSGGVNTLAGTGGTGTEISAVFDVTAIALIDVTGDGTLDVIFGPTLGFASSLEAHLGLAAGDIATGTMAALFRDETPNYFRNTGPDDGDPTFAGADVGLVGAPGGIGVAGALGVVEESIIASAADGALLLTVGFGGDADEVAFTPTVLFGGGASTRDIFAIKTTTQGGNFGIANNQLSILDNFTDVVFGQVGAFTPGVGGDGLIDLTLNTNILSVGGFGGIPPVATGADFFTDSNANFFVVAAVPEPSTLLLLGTGFAALFAYGWRKRS